MRASMLKPLLLMIIAGAMLAQATNESLLMRPDAEEFARRAPDTSRIALDTSKGKMQLELKREWSPRGVDRFCNLVRHGYYDGARFFRIRAGNWAQFGVAGDPKVATAWRQQALPDEPRVLSNTRGTIAYAFKEPKGRTTQVFINLKDNSATHDAPADGMPFVPFARVIEGMEAADALYADYGEQAGGGIRGGKQDVLFEHGNAWLLKNFPKLDYIRTAKIVE